MNRRGRIDAAVVTHGWAIEEPGSMHGTTAVRSGVTGPSDVLSLIRKCNSDTIEVLS
jgi:hypothetical protein